MTGHDRAAGRNGVSDAPPRYNQSEGRFVSRDEDLARTDALEPDMRLLVRFAPYKFKAPPRNWSAERFIAFVFKTRDYQIAKVWGPDHPQIGSRVPERSAKTRRR